MKLLFLATPFFILLTIHSVKSDDDSERFTTKTWFVNPARAAYARGDVSVQSNKGQNAEMTANKQNFQSDANVQGKGNFHAGKTTNDEAEAKTPNGKRAEIDRSKKAQGIRTADAGKYHGELHSSKVNGEDHEDLSTNTGGKIDTVMKGSSAKDAKFNAQGSKGHKYEVDPNTQDKTQGDGVIIMDGVKHNYKENRNSNGDTTAQLDNLQTKRWGTKTFKCLGQKQGVSNCVDENGKKVGEVVSQKDGTVIVKKVGPNGVETPIAKSRAVKNANGQSVVTVNDGLFQAEAGNYRERDCLSDYPEGKPGSKVKLERPLTVKWRSEDVGGKRVYEFPDCVTIGGKLTLPPGIDANRIAIQFDCSILPAGKLKCVDTGSCNKDCHYCNFCNNSRKVDILSNTNGKNLCNLKGGGTYQIAATVCPPPKDFSKAQCTGFTKQDPDYFKKKGDVQCRVLVWVRPANEAEVRAKYWNEAKNNPITLQVLRLKYLALNKQIVNAQNPTDFDLEEIYIKDNGNPKQFLAACVEGTTNYTMSKNSQKASLLLDVGTTALAPKSLFDTRPCPAVDAVNTQQAQAHQQEAKQSKPANQQPSWFNMFGR